MRSEPGSLSEPINNCRNLIDVAKPFKVEFLASLPAPPCRRIGCLSSLCRELSQDNKCFFAQTAARTAEAIDVAHSAPPGEP